MSRTVHPAPARTVVRRPRAGSRREDILAAALTLFGRHGAANVTTRAIAQAVGISQPSLYAHFPSADAIADELCHRAFAALYAGFGDVADNLDDPEQVFMQLGRAYIEFGLTQPDMYRIAFMNFDDEVYDKDCLDPENPDIDPGAQAFNVLLRIVGALRGSDDHQTWLQAQSVWAAIHGLVALMITKPHFPWADREQLIDLHLRGCRALICR